MDRFLLIGSDDDKNMLSLPVLACARVVGACCCDETSLMSLPILARVWRVC